MRKLMLLTAMLMALVVLSIGCSGVVARGKRIGEDTYSVVKGGYEKANNWLTPSPRPLGEKYVRNVGNNVAQILTAEQYKDRAKSMVKKILAAVSGDRSFMGIRFTPRSVVYVNGRAKEVVMKVLISVFKEEPVEMIVTITGFGGKEEIDKFLEAVNTHEQIFFIPRTFPLGPPKLYYQPARVRVNSGISAIGMTRNGVIAIKVHVACIKVKREYPLPVPIPAPASLKPIIKPAPQSLNAQPARGRAR